MSKFQGRYRINSSRLPNWNYAWKGLYFVTVCTRFYENYFGEIINGEMYYSEIGNKVNEEWLKTPESRPDMNITLDKFQVMPNHFHGIIGIGRNKFNPHESTHLTGKEMIAVEDFIENSKNVFGPQSKNLGSIMRGFKSAVTSYAQSNNILFAWHPRFHDVIIRDEVSLMKIRKYIQNNVKNWGKDRFHK